MLRAMPPSRLPGVLLSRARDETLARSACDRIACIQPTPRVTLKMQIRPVEILSAASSQNVVAWFLHLGGIGLIPLGLLDNSVVPLPGSMDVATILLAARDKRLWFYYAAMATI